MWIAVVIIIVFVAIGISMRGQGESKQIEKYNNLENTRDFGQECKDLAEQILRDSHSGCAYSGCCVYDRTETDEETLDDDDDDDEVCYCEHYGEYVKRHSPCEHFKDKKRNNG